jgi:transposase
VQALTGRFDDHHAALARMLLDQIDALSGQIDQLTALIEQTITAIPLPTIKQIALCAAAGRLGMERAAPQGARQ